MQTVDSTGGKTNKRKEPAVQVYSNNVTSRIPTRALKDILWKRFLLNKILHMNFNIYITA